MSEQLQDFGEHIAGAKKETYFKAIDLSNEETKKLPLSKLWTDKDIKDIEDIHIRAVAFALKDSLPNKPRNHYKLSHWLDTLHRHQSTVVDLLQKNDLSYTNAQVDKIADISTKSKAYLLPNVEFDDYKRIGRISFYQSAGSNGVRLSVKIDDKEHSFRPKEPASLVDFDYKKLLDEFTNDIKTILQERQLDTNQPKQMTAQSFDIYVRRADNTAFISAKTDRQKTPLMEFEQLTHARDFLKDGDNIQELSQLWIQHRDFNSIAKADMRNAVNEERVGQSYRDQDITPDEFMATFGVRGGQFGNWVTGDERQAMLNATYDGFMDLSKALNIEPKAIGLNGTLGIAFGARGSGNASAHYERGEQVINLTKTRGAGSLAHEWWHALDHYMKNGDDLLTRHLNATSQARHQELIAPVRELVKDIHKSELYNRSQISDAYRSQPYFSTDVEMTARAFEGHIQHTLSKMGIKNDFLVNIKAEKDWQKNLDAYPYPKAEELEPLGRAYNTVFDTLKEADKEFVPVHYEPEPIVHADTLAVTGAEKTKEIRTEWGDFPPVISNGKLKDLSKELEYEDAKSGSFEQSAKLVENLLKDENIQDIKAMIGNERPIIVPILSEEATGKNRIPQAYAYALASQLDLEVDTNIYQVNTAKRTGSGIYHRYVSPPEFKGEVQRNQPYLIVDDTLSVGGTIATLKGYIENNGGKVIGATVMTAYEQKTTIAIKADMLQSISQKDGLNDFWIKEFGFGLDKLTQQEAGHLKKPTLEQIQENIQEARQQLLINQQEISNEQPTQTHQTQQSTLHTAPKIDTAGRTIPDSSQQAGRAVFQSVLPSQETNPNQRVSTQNTKLNTPYAEKDQAKQLGAKWDSANKTWYAPAGLDLNPFKKWLPQEKEQSKQSSDRLENRPTQAPQGQTNTIPQSQRLYLYTRPSDNQAMQELKAQGIVKFDLPNKLWYTHSDNAEVVKQWATRPNVPTPEQALTDHLHSLGIKVDAGHPIFDNRPHRLANDGSTDKNVMYHAYANQGGVPYARITNFSKGGKSEWTYPTEHLIDLKSIEAVDKAMGQSYTNRSAPTASTLQTSPQSQNLPQEQQEPPKDEVKIALENLMAERAKMLMSFAPIADNNQNYLDKKQVTANGVAHIVPSSDKIPEHLQSHIAIGNTPKQYFWLLANNPENKLVLQRGNLVIPQYNAQGEMRAFETIAYNGRKYALKDAEKKSMMTVLGNLENGKPIVIAEGYATGATLHEHTGRNVVVAFGKNGLMDIAKELRDNYPDSKIYIGADNDHNKEQNYGLQNALAVQGAVKNVYVLTPQFEAGDTGKDWNDVFVDKGVDELKRQLTEQLKAINPDAKKNQEAIKETQAPVQTKDPLDIEIIKQNYPTISDANVQAIQAWKYELEHRYKDDPIRADIMMTRLENKLPDLAQGENLPPPKHKTVSDFTPQNTATEAVRQNDDGRT